MKPKNARDLVDLLVKMKQSKVKAEVVMVVIPNE